MGQFLFRGNAVAAGGFLTKLKGVPVQLDPKVVTVHGESSLPMIGGISHSLVEKPVLEFPQFIQYGQCSSVVEGVGTGNSRTTTLYAAVLNVRTSPSAIPPLGKAPTVPVVSFRATRLAISAKSTHTADGRTYFQLLDAPVTLDMAIVVTPPKGDEIVTSLRLNIDPIFLRPTSIAELDAHFRSDRSFYDSAVAAAGASARNMVYGKSDLPRTPEGYAQCSFVTSYIRGKQDTPIPGNVLREPGLVTIVFGQVLTDGHSRRISLVTHHITRNPEGVPASARAPLADAAGAADLGAAPDSDGEGECAFTGADSNGIWN